MTLLGLLPAIDAALMLVNRVDHRGFGATLLPGLELARRRAAELRTLVAVPTLLDQPRLASTSRSSGSRSTTCPIPPAAVHFALLSDWADATENRCPATRELLAAATAGIARLNARYPGTAGGDRFLLLHRRRVWNAAQERWMGWERKRGKLHELNRLLRGADGHDLPRRRAARRCRPTSATSSRSTPTRGCRATPSRRLVGKMAHPLNRPRFDRRRAAASSRATASCSRASRRRCRSARRARCSSASSRARAASIPTPSAVSDVYQDLFGEGSYTGKGIYDVDAFEAALAGRVPENTLLSHDLFEGIFARAGLVTDIEVVEEFPARYDVAAARQHRWARGDWQLLPWMLGLRRGGRAATTCRRSAAGRCSTTCAARCRAPAAVVALLAGWTLPLPAALAWTAFVLLTILALPPLLPVAVGAAAAPCRASPRAAISARSATTSRIAAAQTGLHRRLPRPPGLADAGCDRAHAVPARSSAAATCSNG